MKLNDIHYSDLDNELLSKVPGRGDLRISLTTSCNLKCRHCHNEGVSQPWKKEVNNITLKKIDNLLAIGDSYGAKSVKFTGGEPSIYHHFLELLDEVELWRNRYVNILKWGISTNGILFLREKYYSSLITSALDNICVGIDSVSPSDNSKPNSPIGISGHDLFEEFIVPLRKAWPNKSIKINVVYDGNESRVRAVVERCINAGVDVSILEINSIVNNGMIRKGFINLFYNLQNEYDCRYKYNKELNENHLYMTSGGKRISFYQDHCADWDCGHCRNIHLRISPNANELGVVPCFLRDIDGFVKITEGGIVSERLFLEALNFVGRGPNWSSEIKNHEAYATKL